MNEGVVTNSRFDLKSTSDKYHQDPHTASFACVSVNRM